MKKITFYSIIIFIFLIISGATIVTLANHPFVMKIIVSKIAPQYNITYDSIDGTIIDGVTINNIKHNNESVATSLKLKWNPLSLLEKKIYLSSVKIDDLNVSATIGMIKDFKNPNNNKSTPPNFDIIIKSGAVNLTRWDINSVQIDNAHLYINKLVFGIKNQDFKNGTVSISAISPLATLELNAEAKDKKLHGNGTLEAMPYLWEKYKVPFDTNNSVPINITNLVFSPHDANITFNSLPKKIWKNNPDTDIKQFNSILFYSFWEKNLTIDSNASIFSPELKDIFITNHITKNIENGFEYHGELNLQLMSLSSSTEKERSTIFYNGNLDSLEANLENKEIIAHFLTQDYTKGIINAKTKHDILLDDYLPISLSGSQGQITIDMPLQINNLLSATPKIVFTSNLLNSTIDARHIDDSWQANAKFDLPNNSLLPKVFPQINWEKISKLQNNITFNDNSTIIDFRDENLNGKIDIDKNNEIQGIINLGNATIQIQGPIESLEISINTNSLDIFSQELQPWLTTPINLPKGDLTAKITLNENKTSEIVFLLNELHVTQKNGSLLNIKGEIKRDDKTWTLSSYEATYDNEIIYATKPSIVEFADDTIILNNLWINDQIQTQGKYNLKTNEGEFVSIANNFDLKTKWLELNGNLNIETFFDGNATTFKGFVDIYDGNLKYNIEQKSSPSDDDIIVLQEQKEPSIFFQNLSTSLKIQTKSPIKYRQDGVSLDLIADLGVEKSQDSDMIVLGMVTIPKGGKYTFNKKEFTLQDSYIYFTGNPNKPMLDIKANHKSLNHQIRISITGSPNAPNIIFSSTPRLSREQILSILLFDSETGAETHSSEEMMKMMGGAIAKSALADIGIGIDHLVLGGDSVEVGKKLTNRITVIYADGEVSSVKVKYNHSRTVEGVLSASPESTSVDIFYKKEAESLSDIIFAPKP